MPGIAYDDDKQRSDDKEPRHFFMTMDGRKFRLDSNQSAKVQLIEYARSLTETQAKVALNRLVEPGGDRTDSIQDPVKAMRAARAARIEANGRRSTQESNY